MNLHAVMDITVIGNQFIAACKENQPDCAKKLFPLMSEYDLVYGFRESCIHNLMELSKWLFSTGKIETTFENNRTFLICCMNGHIEMAQWMNENAHIDPHYHDNVAFYGACEKGHLNIAKWLYSLKKMDIKIDLYDEVCSNGHLEMVEWLHSIGYKATVMSFWLSCKNGHIDIAKWLRDHYYIDERIELAFRYSCQYGHIDIAKWLYSLKHMSYKLQCIYNSNEVHSFLFIYSFIIFSVLHA